MHGNQTPPSPLHAIDPWRRTDYVRDMIDAAVYLATHLGVPCPDRIIADLTVNGHDPDERERDVLITAEALGVVAVEADGWVCAARQFGPVTLQARTPARKAAAA